MFIEDAFLLRAYKPVASICKAPSIDRLRRPPPVNRASSELEALMSKYMGTDKSLCEFNVFCYIYTESLYNLLRNEMIDLKKKDFVTNCFTKVADSSKKQCTGYQNSAHFRWV